MTRLRGKPESSASIRILACRAMMAISRSEFAVPGKA